MNAVLTCVVSDLCSTLVFLNAILQDLTPHSLEPLNDGSEARNNQFAPGTFDSVKYRFATTGFTIKSTNSSHGEMSASVNAPYETPAINHCVAVVYEKYERNTPWMMPAASASGAAMTGEKITNISGAIFG